jgi:hypothetical protein
LEPFDAEATQGAVAEAGSYGHDSESSDLANSDPSWQAQVHASWSQNGASNDKIVVGSPRSADSLDAAMIIRHACGDNLVTESIAVPVRPQSANTTGCNACAYTVFFVNRGGQPLVYFVYWAMALFLTSAINDDLTDREGIQGLKLSLNLHVRSPQFANTTASVLKSRKGAERNQ